MSADAARRRGRAHVGLRREARVHALVGHASLVIGAVGVDVALDTLAANEGVADKAGRTAAVGLVVARLADGVDGAGVGHQAGVGALVVVADLVGAAVGIDDALHCE